MKVVADLSAPALKELAEDLIKAIEGFTNKPFPNKPIDHLTQSIEAVFKSWNSERAQLYRRRERIPSDLGTAVNIQSMVFVNLSDGESKHKTKVGDHVRIGSDTMLVAPVSVGDGAYTAAGSVINEDVPAGAIGIARARQVNILGWVLKKRKDSKSAAAAKKAGAKE